MQLKRSVLSGLIIVLATAASAAAQQRAQSGCPDASDCVIATVSGAVTAHWIGNGAAISGPDGTVMMFHGPNGRGFNFQRNSNAPFVAGKYVIGSTCRTNDLPAAQFGVLYVELAGAGVNGEGGTVIVDKIANGQISGSFEFSGCKIGSETADTRLEGKFNVQYSHF